MKKLLMLFTVLLIVGCGADKPKQNPVITALGGTLSLDVTPNAQGTLPVIAISFEKVTTQSVDETTNPGVVVLNPTDEQLSNMEWDLLSLDGFPYPLFKTHSGTSADASPSRGIALLLAEEPLDEQKAEIFFDRVEKDIAAQAIWTPDDMGPNGEGHPGPKGSKIVRSANPILLDSMSGNGWIKVDYSQQPPVISPTYNVFLLERRNGDLIKFQVTHYKLIRGTAGQGGKTELNILWEKLD